MKKEDIGLLELRAKFLYDSESGHLINRKTGKMAGSILVQTRTKKPYRRLMYKGFEYREHRLIWFYVYGNWPTEIDHINGDGTDNRLINLREVTRSENMRNTKLRSDSTSGICGVTWLKDRSKWLARVVGIDGKRLYLGCYESKEQAEEAVLNGQKGNKYHHNHGMDRPL